MPRRTLWFVVLFTALVVAPAAAQDAAPKGDLAVPDPARCRVEPRPLADLQRLSATPAAAAPAPADPRPDLGDGAPADPETVAAVTATIEHLYACYNAGDYLRAFALFTDDGLRRALPGLGLTAKDLAFIAGPPVPPPKAAWQAVAVRQVTTLSDGRARARLDGGAPVGPFAADVVLLETDGQYRIDHLLPVKAASGAATPEA